MSGRFRGGGRGGARGGYKGRGRVRSNPSHVKQQETKKKKMIEDYFFYVGSSKQASDFETTSEFLINHVKKTFDRGNDIAEALRTLLPQDTELWKPVLGFSNDANEVVAKQEDRQNEIEFKANLDEFMKRKRMYENNLFKAYALIWERCAKAMQNKISSRSSFESKIYNDPIELLMAIKEHALNYQESRYEMSIISDAFRAVFHVHQKENENLQDYTKRFKTSREILESHLGGQIILSKYVKTMSTYDENDQEEITKCIETASEQLFAFLYMENSDQAKYGLLLRGLKSQKSLGHDQYPKSISEANNVLSNHNFDENRTNKTNHNKNGRNKNNNKNNNQDKEDESPDDAPVLSFAQMEGKCYCCGKVGHKSPECRHAKDTKREDWAINKSQSHAQPQVEPPSVIGQLLTPSSVASETKSEPKVGWAGVHCSFAHAANLSEMILLDSDSTDSVFCNPSYVTNIRNTKETLKVLTNGGIMNSTQKCDVPYIGECWFNKESITNIIAMSNMRKKYRITMDTNKEAALIVHLPNKTVKFKEWPNGLYAMNPSEPDSPESIPNQYQMIQTIEENNKFLYTRQQNRRRIDRKRCHTDAMQAVSD